MTDSDFPGMQVAARESKCWGGKNGERKVSLFVPTESFLSYREKTRCRTEGELSLFYSPETRD